MSPDLKILPITGKNIAAYLPSIARIRVEIMREYPFLQNKTIEDELKLLKKYTLTPEAIVVLVFDGPEIVGVSTGIPFSRESESYHKPFLEKQLDPSSYFFFTESLLLKPYRGRGLGHHFYELREQHVKTLKKYKQICFCAIQRKQPAPPKDDFPLNDFWRKRGYTEHPELEIPLLWKDTQEKKKSEKQGRFWVKNLDF